MFFKNEELNTIIVSIICGFGVACLFKKVCHNKKCVVIKAPKKLKLKNLKKDNKCFNLNKKIIPCHN